MATFPFTRDLFIWYYIFLVLFIFLYIYIRECIIAVTVVDPEDSLICQPQASVQRLRESHVKKKL